MLRFDFKRKLSFILLFCILFLSTPSLEVLAFGYKEAATVMSGLDLSVGDILLSNTNYTIKNEFYFRENDNVYHATGRNILTTSDGPVLSNADRLILEFNDSTYTRSYSWPRLSNGSTQITKYPYYYNDANKSDVQANKNSETGDFEFILSTTMENTNYIITAMAPVTNSNTSGGTHYDYRIVLEPIPAGIEVVPEVHQGDKFEGGKTYAFLFLEDEIERLGQVTGNNSEKYDLHSVYGFAGDASYMNAYIDDKVSFSFDLLVQDADGDIPLYSKEIYTGIDQDSMDTWYTSRYNTEKPDIVNTRMGVPTRSVITVVNYVTFPEGREYEYKGVSVKALNNGGFFNAKQYTYEFVSEGISIVYHDYVTGELVAVRHFESADDIVPINDNNYVGWVTFEESLGVRTNIQHIDENTIKDSIVLYGIPKKLKTSFVDISEVYQKYPNNIFAADVATLESSQIGYFELQSDFNFNDITSFKYNLLRNEKFKTEDYPCLAAAPYNRQPNNITAAQDISSVKIEDLRKKYQNLDILFFYPAKVNAQCLRGDTGEEINISRLSNDIYFSINNTDVEENMDIMSSSTSAINIGYSIYTTSNFSDEYPYVVRYHANAYRYVDSDDPTFQEQTDYINFFSDDRCTKVYVGIPDTTDSTCTAKGDLTYTVSTVTDAGSPFVKTKSRLRELGHIWENLEYREIDITNPQTYAFVTAVNSNVTDKESLVRYADNSSEVEEHIDDDGIIVYAALCVRAQDAYVLKLGNPPVISIGVGDYHWNDITEGVDFNIFFNTAKNVSLSAEAFDADIVDVSYYVSAHEVDISAINEWSVISYEDDSDMAGDNEAYNVHQKVHSVSGNDIGSVSGNNLEENTESSDVDDANSTAALMSSKDDGIEVFADIQDEQPRELHSVDYPTLFNIDTYGKHVIYARVTDTNGNVGYASSNGIVFDNISPEFLGGVVNNGEIYESSLVFGVYDEYLSRVWIDGREVGLLDNYTMTNDQASHTLRAVDKAGNESTLTFTFKVNEPGSSPTPTPDEPGPSPTPTPEATPTPSPDDPTPTPVPNSPAPPSGSDGPHNPEPNQTTLVVPQTGLLQWPIAVLGLLGFINISLGIYLRIKGKEDHK